MADSIEREHFMILAEYNRRANEALFGLLAAFPAGELAKPRGSYFDSIQGVLVHIMRGDINWLRRFRELFPAMEVFASPRLDPPGHAWTAYEFAAFDELGRDRILVDGFFSEFARKADIGRFGEVLAYGDSHGNPRRYVFRQVLDHVFNHQTHHRGQVSQILDELGVEHDFSNILSVLAIPG